jgi:uroporphyrinogen-III synthase
LKTWARGGIQAVTITSGQGLRNLFDMVGAVGQQWLKCTPMVVFGERTRKLATDMGIKQPPIVAREASDEAIVEALERWRRATPG